MRYLMAIALAASLPMEVLSCSCFGPQTFCGTLDPQPPEFPEPQGWIPSDIILAVKLGDHQYAADVKVLQVFSGNLHANDQIRVWGDCGLLCRHYVNGNVGDTVLWAIQHCDLMGNGPCGTEYESASDYQLSICGVYWLGYQNGIVSGPLTTEDPSETMPIGAFQALVNTCLATGVHAAAAPDPLVVRYADGTPMLSANVPDAYELTVRDVRGRAVLRRGWNGSPLQLVELPVGAFIVEVRGREARWVRKVVVH